MKKKKLFQKYLSMLLAVILIVGLLPVPAMAETDSLSLNQSGTILLFEELLPEITAQSVPIGTSESELNLPKTLTAEVCLTSTPEAGESGLKGQDSSAVTGSAVTTNEGDESGLTGQQSTGKEEISLSVIINVPVTWTASPEYYGDTADKYLFTPALPEGFTLVDSISLPTITVTVEQVTAYGEITAFDNLSDELRWQNTISPNLPETVRGAVLGKAVDIPVTWSADHEYNADFPSKGLYVFTAEVGIGYTIADGVEMPRITVYIPALQKKLMSYSGTGTSDSVLIITTAAQLAEITTLVNAGRLETFLLNNKEATVYLTLGNDINLSAYGEGWNDGYGWVPIGTWSAPFKGCFDGGGNKITGLYINHSDWNYMGLFGLLENGTVKNLDISGAYISAGQYIGGVASLVNSTSNITNCSVSGEITGTYHVGGVAGSVTGNNNVTNCSVSGVVTGTEYVGGVAGVVADGGIVRNCYTTGAVTGTEAEIGGVAGILEDGGNVTSCYTTSAVSGDGLVGGVVGGIYGNSSLTDCVALNPSVIGGSSAGRVTGFKDGVLNGNTAFVGMTGSGNHKTTDGLDGEDINISQINEDGTLGGRFTSINGWTVEPGKLPGLGVTIEMPDYLSSYHDPYFGGKGTQISPYQISTAAQLAELAQLVNEGNTNYSDKNYKLTANIDLSDYNADNTGFNGGKGWIPIGKNIFAFKGTFDGNNNEISGLYINNDLADEIGLFGNVANGTIKDFDMVDVQIVGHSFVGGVAGSMENGSLTNCSVAGTVTGSIDYVGGVVGIVKNGCSIKSCKVTSPITGRRNIGGVAGQVYGSVTNCYTTGTINGNSVVGGVAGIVEAGGSVTNCYATGMIDGQLSGVGGVTGQVYGSVTKCYATGAVIGSSSVGGVAGSVVDNEGIVVGNVRDCVALNPSVKSNVNGTVGRVAGYETFHYGLSDINMAFSGMTIEGGSPAMQNGVNGTDISPEEIEMDGTIKNYFNDTNNWTTQDGKLPGLFGAAMELPDYLVSGSDSNFQGMGTQTNPYLIGTAEQLVKLAKLVNADDINYNSKYYKLTTDIDLSCYNASNTDFNYGKGWVPIGFLEVNPFSGTFDGNSHKISGLYINTSNLYAGLFGCVYSGTVMNLGITDANINGSDMIGGVAGSIYEGNINNCYSTGLFTGMSGVGGVVGENRGNAENCYSTGTVIGTDHIGGIFGIIRDSSVTNCYSTGKITGIKDVGGVVGSIFNGSLTNCYSTGIVTGDMEIGGVVGNILNSELAHGELINCVALNPNVNGKAAANRVVGYAVSPFPLSCNYAFSGMLGGGSEKTANGRDGADITVTQLNTADFWANADNWNISGWNKDIWTLQDGKLPVLKKVGGVQNSEGGLYLTKRDIGNAAVTLDQSSYTYDGTLKSSIPTITFDGIMLVKGTDYTYKITSVDGEGTSAGIQAGTVSLGIIGNGNFSGTKTVTYTINKAPAPTLPWPVAAAVIYGAKLSDSVLMGGSTTYGSFTWTNGDTIPTVVNSGYSVTFTPSAATETNYNTITDITHTVELSVNKAPAPIIAPQSVNIYLGTASTGNTINLAALLPVDRGISNYNIISTNKLVSNVSIYDSGILSFDTLTSNTVNSENITVKAKMQNYENALFTIKVDFVDKKVPIVTPSVSGTLNYGQLLSKLTIKATALEVNGSTPVSGSITWNDPTSKPAVGSPAQSWTFTPNDTAVYEIVTGTVSITVNKAAPQGTPTITQISTTGKNLSDAILTGNFTNPYDGLPVPGTISWDLPDATTVTQGTAYSWTFIPEDTINYSIRTGSLTPYPGSADGGSSSGGSSSGGSSGSTASTTTTITEPEKRPVQPLTVSVSVTAAKGKKGTIGVDIPDNIITKAIAKMQSETKTLGKATDRISVVLNINAGKGRTASSATLSHNALKALINSGVSSLTINGLPISISFDLKALQAIWSQSSGNVIITVVPVHKLSKRANSVIGTRPIYNISMSYTKNEKFFPITSLCGGTATVSIPYKPTKVEFAGSLYAVYIDGKGNPSRIIGSVYDTSNNCLIFTIHNFSIYGVGYNAPSEKNSDALKH